MPRTFDELAGFHARYGDVDARVHELLAAVRRACEIGAGESWNRANERKAEEFIAWLGQEFPGRTQERQRGPKPPALGPDDGRPWEEAQRAEDPTVIIERQRLSAWALRTTRWNYVFTLPGESQASVVLVAHYDTWRGPGADDNTTGEEILKQYLLADLRAARRPPLTRTYFLAGSEECGLVGLTSQILLALGLVAANLALVSRDWLSAAVAVALCPLASYRFGVSGSREYVRSLSQAELRRIRAVLSVDSVGEGRMYIPRSTLGADFIRALIPFGDYDSLNDLLEEGAHLHGIKYNSHLAGGTTDHVSFLEVNNGLRQRLAEAARRVWALLTRREHVPSLRVPASALIAMGPGKASPLVFGGKIHTRDDVPERVYPEPLREALCVTDYLLYRIDGGRRPREPRTLGEYHYARLYQSRQGRYYAVLKDAIEHNRRNLNGVYPASAVVEGRKAQAELGPIAGWGVEVRLRDQADALAAERGERWERVPIEELEVAGAGLRLRFARRRALRHFVERILRRGLARLERAMGQYSFVTFFLVAWVVADVFGRGLELAVRRFEAFGPWFFDHALLTVPLLVAGQAAVALYFIMRRIPTWIDNAYRHECRADNLGSLRRVRSEKR